MRVYVTIGMLLAMVMAGCTVPPAATIPDLEVITAPGAPTELPFSSAVRTGNLLILSGQIGFLPGTRELPEGVAEQTRQTLENIDAVLHYAGSSRTRVLKCTVFLRTMDDYGAMNAAYAAFFGDHRPARSAVAGSGLAFDAAVEIECLALAGAT